MKRTTALLLSFLFALAGAAQQNQILSERIHTLQVEVDGDENRLPVIELGSNEFFNISFDELSHEYRRYTYKVQHCGFDWQPSEELFESDFLSSPDNEGVIDRYTQSMNTSVLYTHYAFSFPNATTRPLLSGNYRIDIMTEGDDGEPATVAVVCCAIVDPQAVVSATVSTDTDIDRNATHQQLSMAVDWKSLPVRDARKELKAVVMQNRRCDNAVIDPAATSVASSSLVWDHCRELIFEAGNEYRKFEVLNLRAGGMGVERIRWYDPYYHVELYEGERRRNYLYDEDRNGQRVVRTEDSGDPDTDSDYFFAHFSLKTAPLPDAAVCIAGRWTNGLFAPPYLMRYNDERGAYEATLLLKQGYYSYLYLATDVAAPSRGRTAPIEGDYYQTENEYAVLVYFRRSGDRYDQLVGQLTLDFRPQ